MSGKDFVDNIGRKKWDLSKYQEKAQALLDEDDDDSIYNALESKKKDKFAVVRRDPLKARTWEVDLESRVGKYAVVTTGSKLSQRGGYYCDVCECLLNDSKSYLDHINGQKHQKRLGMSMVAERATLSQVRKRLEQHKRKKDLMKGGGDFGDTVADRLARADAELKSKKRARKLAAQEELATAQDSDNEDRDDDGEEEDDDDLDEDSCKPKKKAQKKQEPEEEEDDPDTAAMKAMMGFGSFAQGKNR